MRTAQGQTSVCFAPKGRDLKKKSLCPKMEEATLADSTRARADLHVTLSTWNPVLITLQQRTITGPHDPRAPETRGCEASCRLAAGRAALLPGRVQPRAFPLRQPRPGSLLSPPGADFLADLSLRFGSQSHSSLGEGATWRERKKPDPGPCWMGPQRESPLQGSEGLRTVLIPLTSHIRFHTARDQ